MSKFLEYDRVLCLSPHPDDVEYSMSGTIMKFDETQFDVVCLSQGGDFDVTTHIKRLAEVRKFWEKSGCENVSTHFSGNRHVKDLTEDLWVNWLEETFINQAEYDAVFVTSPNDSHFEHRITNRLAYPLSRLEKISIIEYCSPSTLDTWVPSAFIDINAEFERKVAALQEFRTQETRRYFLRKTIEDFNSNFRCSKRGLHWVEQFKFIQVFN